jgi:hypothetical protein
MMSIPNVRAVQMPKKIWAEAQGNMLPALMSDFSELTKGQKEVLATVTSIANTCGY